MSEREIDERPVIDVYHLPGSALDARHPVWWGNTLMLLIETTTVGIMIMIYLYVRKNFDPWPPPLSDRIDAVLHPVPRLAAGTVNTLLLVVSCWPMARLDARARRHLRTLERAEQESRPAETRASSSDSAGFLRVLILLLVIGVASTALRFVEFSGLRFSWAANAYGSAVWTVLFLHLLYILMSVGEVALLVIWVGQRGLTDKFAGDTTLAAGSWYWTVGVWLILYLLVYWSPRLM